MATTCHNKDCKKRNICNFNIWEANDKNNPICPDYKSAKRSIYEEYLKITDNPLPRNIYFEE